MGNNRERHIDVMKGLCMIAIIVSHCTWTIDERKQLLFPFWIDMAVPILLIINGYVNAKSYDRANINCLEDAYSVDNIVKKIMRFTIPFLIVYVIENIYWISSGQKTSLLAVILYFFTGGYGAGSYFFPIMYQLIFVYPIIYYLIKKYQLKGLAICTTVNIMYELLQRAYSMSEITYRLLIFRYLMVIAVGCYLAIGKQPIKKKWYVVSILCGWAFSVAYNYAGYTPQILVYWITTSWLGSMYIIPFVAWYIGKCRIKCAPLELIGKASYNIFLVQMFYFWINPVADLNVTIGSKVFLNLVICLLIGIVYYLIENPITKYLVIRLSCYTNEGK